MKAKIFFVLAALLALVWIIADRGFVRRRATDQDGVASADVDSKQDAAHEVELGLAEQSRTLRGLTERVTQLSSRLEALEARALPPGQKESEREHADGASTALSKQAAPQLSREEYLAQLEMSFGTERPDRAWAVKKTEGIRDILQDLPTLGLALRSVECRSQRCRVELKEDSSVEFSNAMMTLTAKMASVLPTADYQYVDRGNGERSLVIYFSELMAPKRAPSAQNM